MKTMNVNKQNGSIMFEEDKIPDGTRFLNDNDYL